MPIVNNNKFSTILQDPNIDFTGAVGGMADYNDTATASTPITLVADTWTTITNDGLGSFTNLIHFPVDVTSLMNTPAGSFDFSELPLGCVVMIRNDMTITPTNNNSLLETRLQLGTGGNTYTLETTLGRLDSGSGIPYRFSLSPLMIYMGDLNTRDNPVLLQVRLSGGGTLVNAGSSIGVQL